MRQPFQPFKIDGIFGEKRSYGLHNGEDYNGIHGGNTDMGTPLLAVIDKYEVEHVSQSTQGFGNIVVYRVETPLGERFIQHCHCDRLQPSDIPGAVATMGSTGNSTASHDHRIVWKKRPPRNNWRMVAKDNATLTEYYEPFSSFFEQLKDWEPEVKSEYKWLEDFAHENGVEKDNIEGWVREMHGAWKQVDNYKQIAENEAEKNKDFEKEIADLKDELEACQEGGETMPSKNPDYQNWKKSAWTFGRVFIAAAIGAIAPQIDQLLAGDFNVLQAAIGAGLAALITAASKYVRETSKSQEDKPYESLIHKLPV